MKLFKKFISIVSIILFFGCSGENCTIDFKSNPSLYKNTLNSLFSLNLEMESEEPYYQPIQKIRVEDGIVSPEVFKEIDFIEVHKDSTFCKLNWAPVTYLITGPIFLFIFTLLMYINCLRIYIFTPIMYINYPPMYIFTSIMYIN